VLGDGLFSFIAECIEMIYTLSWQFECVDDGNMLGGRIHPIEKKTEVLVVSSMENVLDVNADKTKYKVMP
jgi:hypothetical protein